MANMMGDQVVVIGTVKDALTIYNTPEIELDEHDVPIAHWWWLSFADDEGCRGVCLVQGVTFLAAVLRANALGISPHGQVVGDDLGPDISPDWPDPAVRDRCLSADELRARGMVA